VQKKEGGSLHGHLRTFGPRTVMMIGSSAEKIICLQYKCLC